MNEVSLKVHEQISSKKAELMRLDVDQLRELPSYAEEEFDVNGKPQVLGIWREEIESGETLIVTQCKNTKLLGIGNMLAEGFVVGLNGQVRDADQKLLWDYR